MPFIPNTPESKAAAIGRADSLNPATTCRGVSVSSGKPCRRPTGNSPAGTPTKSDSPPNPNEQYFCWQHKEQAADFYALRHTPSQKIRRLQGRTSLDTLIEVVIGHSDGADDDEEVVGLVNPSTFSQNGPILIKKDSVKVVRKGKAANSGRPLTMSEISAGAYGLSSNGSGSGYTGGYNLEKRPSHVHHESTASSHLAKPLQIRHETKPSLFKRIFCCVKPQTYYTEHDQDSDDFAVPPRKVERPSSNSRPSHHVKFDTIPQGPPLPRMAVKTAKPALSKSQDESDSDSDESDGSSSYDSSDSATRKKVPSSVPVPELPVSLSRRTRNLLAEEVKKPVSQKDEEGYIYVFWLRDGAAAPPNSNENSSSNVSNSPARKPLKGGPKTEARLNAAMLADETGNAEKRLLLKIGRANNVQRRLHEWSNQCGYNLSLIRYYPHRSVSLEEEQGELAAAPIKVPFSHRVERLIHLELRDANFNKPHRCTACERLHREWFSVPATRDGLAHVDEAIKRWVNWAEVAQQAMEGVPVDSPASQTSQTDWARRPSQTNDMDFVGSARKYSQATENVSARKSSQASENISTRKPSQSSQTGAPRKPSQASQTSPPRKPSASSSTPVKKDTTPKRKPVKRDDDGEYRPPSNSSASTSSSFHDDEKLRARMQKMSISDKPRQYY